MCCSMYTVPVRGYTDVLNRLLQRLPNSILATIARQMHLPIVERIPAQRTRTSIARLEPLEQT